MDLFGEDEPLRMTRPELRFQANTNDFEQTIVRHLGGLDPKYADVVDLHVDTAFDEVCMLAHKAEQNRK